MIRLEGIGRDFAVGDQMVTALTNVNLSFEAGDYAAIMGPSGSGKSTLLNIVGLLDRPTTGNYYLEGQNVTDLNDTETARVRREKIGFVFQFFHLVPRLNAEDNVALPMTLAGVAPQERRRRVTDVLRSLGLADRGRHRPDQLSGGQRQRVAIARATVMRPAVILADEPTGNLDTKSGREVLQILEQLNDRGMTLIVVTHDSEIGDRARRRIGLVDGAVETDVRQR